MQEEENTVADLHRAISRTAAKVHSIEEKRAHFRRMAREQVSGMN